LKRLKAHLFSSLVAAALFALLLAPAVAEAAAWVQVTSPSSNELHAVASVSANDVWAVGVGPITEHWNGSAWSVVSSPAVASGKLLGVAAAATNDVWAVGFTLIGSPPLIEHWNGTSWRTVKAPKQACVLNAVTAVSSTDVWAVGDSGNGTLTEQWNGKKWSVVPSPNVGTQPNELFGVAAVSASDIWAVGFSEPNPSVFRTLTLHWDGTSWSIVTSPSPVNDTLRAVAAVSTSDVWAVGGQRQRDADRALER
jgi:hypothetical protein